MGCESWWTENKTPKLQFHVTPHFVAVTAGGGQWPCSHPSLASDTAPACHRVRQDLPWVNGEPVMFVPVVYPLCGSGGEGQPGEKSLPVLPLTADCSRGELRACGTEERPGGGWSGPGMVRTSTGEVSKMEVNAEAAAGVLTAAQLSWTCKLIGCCEVATFLGTEEDWQWSNVYIWLQSLQKKSEFFQIQRREEFFLFFFFF